MQYVILEIKTEFKNYIFKTTERQLENIQFQLDIVPKKLYPTLTSKGIEKHKQEVIIKKLGLRVQDIKSVRKIDKLYLRVLIATNLIADYDVSFSVDTLCTQEIIVCNAVSEPKPMGFCIRPLLVVPDSLYRIAYENGVFATKLSEYLKQKKKELGSKWLRKE